MPTGVYPRIRGLRLNKPGLRFDITGQRFGLLVVTKLVGKNKYNSYLWECNCDCGGKAVVSTGDLRGGTKSCGCLRIAHSRAIAHNRRGKGRNDGRQDWRWKVWRDAVFKRDNYTCQAPGEHRGRLEAHHIKSWEDSPELRHDVSNGLTLCKLHHNREEAERRIRKTFDAGFLAALEVTGASIDEKQKARKEELYIEFRKKRVQSVGQR